MSSSIRSLLTTGTKLWIDSVDPELVREQRELGATGATSNPVIISNLIKTGHFDAELEEGLRMGLDDSLIAWRLTDRLVTQAEEVFYPVWQQTRGNDGYVSFEVDPLLEDAELGPPHLVRVKRYIELAQQWSTGHPNRMIKIPATPAGTEAMEELAAVGVPINATLIFTPRQYCMARDALWRGAQRGGNLARFKSVYSIFISRIDVYTEEHVPELSPSTQGLVGIVIAKRIWAENQKFWRHTKGLRLDQEIVFASTGTKKPGDVPWKYAEALAGSDIETNPPATNQALAASGLTFTRQVDRLPCAEILTEIDSKVDMDRLERVLMQEGIQKFTDPQKALYALVAEKRNALTTSHHDTQCDAKNSP